MWYKIIYICLLGLTFSRASASDSIIWRIAGIDIYGNERTKSDYILRELDFSIGHQFVEKEKQKLRLRNENRLLNTALFYHVKIDFEQFGEEGDQVNVSIRLKEFRKLSFAPRLALADRNFNVWLEQKKNLFDRLNFGVTTRLNNINGHNDRLYLITQVGYTQMLELGYKVPYINYYKTLGINARISLSRNRELNYATIDNQQAFRVDPGVFLFKSVLAEATISYRPEILWKHEISLEYNRRFIDDYVFSELNPDFFRNGLAQIYDGIKYKISFEDRDRIPYPELGTYFFGYIHKQGVVYRDDLNMTYVGGEFGRYYKLSNRWSVESIFNGRVSLRRANPGYFQLRALGFGQEYLRGYELYLLDGLDFMYTKQSLRYKVFHRNIKLWDWIPWDPFRIAPFKIYLTLNADGGYVNNPFALENNTFTNRILAGGGFGIDFVAYLDYVVTLEYSYNHIWQSGIYLHYKFGIK